MKYLLVVGTRNFAGCKPRRKVRLKQALMLKQNGMCPWCGRPMSLNYATFEHIVPVSLGGTNDRENLALAHSECNKRRSNNTNLRPVANPAFGFITERLDKLVK